MTSTFGWLDTDSEQRRRMLEVVDLFKEEGTVDELGIGSIRDALADSLFPGTSVPAHPAPLRPVHPVAAPTGRPEGDATGDERGVPQPGVSADRQPARRWRDAGGHRQHGAEQPQADAERDVLGRAGGVGHPDVGLLGRRLTSDGSTTIASSPGAPPTRTIPRPANCSPAPGSTRTCRSRRTDLLKACRLRPDGRGGAVPLRPDRRLDERIDALVADPPPAGQPALTTSGRSTTSTPHPHSWRSSSTTRDASTPRSTARRSSTTCCWHAKAGRDDLAADYEDAPRPVAQRTASHGGARRLEPHRLVGDDPAPKSAPAADHDAVRRSLARSH